MDSAACVVVIELLSRIAKGLNGYNYEKKVVVTVSIDHQPVSLVFLTLDRIYCPSQVSLYLEFKLSIMHGMEDNSADIMMESSCGCFGKQVIDKSV